MGLHVDWTPVYAGVTELNLWPRSRTFRGMEEIV